MLVIVFYESKSDDEPKSRKCTEVHICTKESPCSILDNIKLDKVTSIKMHDIDSGELICEMEDVICEMEDVK